MTVDTYNYSIVRVGTEYRDLLWSQLCITDGTICCRYDNMIALLSLVAPQLDVMTTYVATSNEKGGIMTTLGLQWDDMTVVPVMTSRLACPIMFIHAQLAIGQHWFRQWQRNPVTEPLIHSWKKVVTPPPEATILMWVEFWCFQWPKIDMKCTCECFLTKSDLTLARLSLQWQVGSSTSSGPFY